VDANIFLRIENFFGLGRAKKNSCKKINWHTKKFRKLGWCNESVQIGLFKHCANISDAH